MIPVTRAAELLDEIVAVVDDEAVMRSELDHFSARIMQQLQSKGAELPPPEVMQKQILDRLIVMKLQLQLAKRSGVTIDDQSLNHAIESIASQNKMSLADFRRTLEKEGYDFGRFREDIRDEMTISRLKQREVDNRIAVSDREVDNYLANKSKQNDNSENEYHLAHILVATPEGASPEQIAVAKAKAEKLLGELRAGADFAKTAIASSDGAQALDGGDLGWRRPAQIPQLLMDAANQLKPGEISGLLRGPSGFAIIKMIEMRSTDTVHMVTQTHARHILIKPSELVSKNDAMQKLAQLKTRIQDGDDFGELARSHSDDRGTAAKGGDLGWVNPGDLVPEFEQVMNGLKVGEISDPFETEFGVHIVQVLERRQHDDTEEAKRAQAREAILRRKIEEETQAWIRRLRDEAYIEYRLTPDTHSSG
ncbi:MAG TPA: peptidylprolyl isomerase [Gammaproteobacteria bacterium]|nr:peptidylprolyl isomerase [Gammaproteobacteria bacterium]